MFSLLKSKINEGELCAIWSFMSYIARLKLRDCCLDLANLLGGRIAFQSEFDRCVLIIVAQVREELDLC